MKMIIKSKTGADYVDVFDFKVKTEQPISNRSIDISLEFKIIGDSYFIPRFYKVNISTQIEEKIYQFCGCFIKNIETFYNNNYNKVVNNYILHVDFFNIYEDIKKLRKLKLEQIEYEIKGG